ncbi:DUF262 domain-containing protein [Sphingobacterium thalpophilum]|uniref:DUF262 domain-containing protein n=1 Tax=Sphingobacterium thalpophilum TaxID=259 RepID=A0ABV4HB72_9SPHI
MQNRVLNLYPIDYPFETLVSRVKDNKLKLDPDFQRKYKWDKDGYERASRFIESCLMRIPLPACYFAENANNSQDVIDGVQRITTITDFFDDKFALEGLSVFTDLEGKKFSELGDYKSDLETTTIRCIILRKDNPKELVNEIFARLNQGAVELTSQEIRHAVYPGTLNNLLQELSKDSRIQEFKTGEKGKTVNDGREPEEMVLRYFALNNELIDYNDKLAKYLDTFMKNNQNLPSDQIDLLKESFTRSFQNSYKVFGDNAFKNLANKQQRQSLALYDLIMYSFDKLTDEFINNNKHRIYQLFEDLCKVPEFRNSFSGGLQKKYGIIRRRILWQEKLDSIK